VSRACALAVDRPSEPPTAGKTGAVRAAYVEGRSIADLVPEHIAGTRRAAALDHDVIVRRGQDYTLRVSAAPCVHHRLLARSQPLDGGHGSPAVPAQREARREYANRVSTLAPKHDHSRHQRLQLDGLHHTPP
jgi:hypothetical protein